MLVKVPKKFFSTPFIVVLTFEDTAAMIPPMKSKYFQKRTQFFGVQLARVSQNYS